jgi:hypothetical protein
MSLKSLRNKIESVTLSNIELPPPCVKRIPSRSPTTTT